MLDAADLIIRLLTLGVAGFGAWKIFQELRVMNRSRPLLYPVLRSGLGGASVELLNVTGKPVVFTEHAFRYLSMEGREGLTPYFTSLEREQKLPIKLNDGESFTLVDHLQLGDRLEVSLNCFLNGHAFQWATTVEAHLSARNTYADITPPTLIKLPAFSGS